MDVGSGNATWAWLYAVGIIRRQQSSKKPPSAKAEGGFFYRFYIEEK